MSTPGIQRSPEDEFSEEVQHERPALTLVQPEVHSAERCQDPMLAEIVEHACTTTGANGAALAMEDKGAVICCARAGEKAPLLGAELDREAGISGLCLRLGETVRCDDAANDPRVDSEAARALGISSILAVPLKSQGATVGLLEVFSELSSAFGEEEEALLQIAAERILLNRELGSTTVLDGVQDFLANIEDQPAPFETSELPLPPADIADVPAQVVSEAEPVTATASDESASGEESEPDAESSVKTAERKSTRRLAAWIGGLAVVAGAAIGLSVSWGVAKPDSPAAPPAISSQAQSLRQAAISGESSAQYELAMRYRGGEGVERDDTEAVRWLKEAARLGNGDAQYELGNSYADGRGVERDPINAYACYVLAGANGNSASDQALKFLTPKLSGEQIGQVRATIGQMYLVGRGTPVDLVAAYTWFQLAESAGNADGQRQRQALASKMSRAQIATAERRASEWLRRHGQRPR